MFKDKGSSINDVTAFWRQFISLSTNKRDSGGKGVRNCTTSFMDAPNGIFFSDMRSKTCDLNRDKTGISETLQLPQKTLSSSYYWWSCFRDPILPVNCKIKIISYCHSVNVIKKCLLSKKWSYFWEVLFFGYTGSWERLCWNIVSVVRSKAKSYFSMSTLRDGTLFQQTNTFSDETWFCQLCCERSNYSLLELLQKLVLTDDKNRNCTFCIPFYFGFEPQHYKNVFAQPQIPIFGNEVAKFKFY